MFFSMGETRYNLKFELIQRNMFKEMHCLVLLSSCLINNA